MRAGYNTSPCSTYWVSRETTSDPNAAPAKVPRRKNRTRVPIWSAELKVYPLLHFKQGRRVAPPPLQIVVLSLFLGKYMDDNLAVV
jgi:hypothetical protein